MYLTLLMMCGRFYFVLEVGSLLYVLFYIVVKSGSGFHSVTINEMNRATNERENF